MSGEAFAFACWVRLQWPRLCEVGWAELVGEEELNAMLLDDWRSGAR